VEKRKETTEGKRKGMEGNLLHIGEQINLRGGKKLGPAEKKLGKSPEKRDGCQSRERRG